MIKLKKNKIFELSILYLCLFLIQGCVGIGGTVIKSHTESIDYPEISKNYGKVSENQLFSKLTSGEKIKSYWGAPTRINILGQYKEEWTYQYQGLDYSRWRGAFILLGIVPVPLMLPVGSEEVTLSLENGTVKNATIVESHQYSTGCYFFFMSPEGPHFDRSNGNVIHHHFKEIFNDNLIISKQ